MKPPSHDVLLFDIGHVLLDFVGPQALDELTGRRLGVRETARRWVASPAIRRFETGRCTTEAFARDFVAEWELPLEPAAFLEIFSTWAVGAYPGAVELVESLKGRYRLACLSNINDVYWPRCRDEFGFGALFECTYVSHEIGILKPDPGIYRHAIEDLGVAPERIGFFDDSPPNVRAARALGVDAHRAVGVEGLREALDGLGLLAPV